MQEAQPGARAHGYVTGVQDYGVFVGFCGDLRGLAPVSELGLPAGQRPSQGFKVGQVSLVVCLKSHEPGLYARQHSYHRVRVSQAC